MECQAATLNSLRWIFNGHPMPRDVSAPIRSAILAGKCCNLQFSSHRCYPSIHISLFHPLSSHQITSLYSENRRFLFASLGISVCVFKSLSRSIFTGALWMCPPFSIFSLFFLIFSLFFNERCLIKQLQKFAFLSVFPLASLGLFLPAPWRHYSSLSLSLCVLAQ